MTVLTTCKPAVLSSYEKTMACMKVHAKDLQDILRSIHNATTISVEDFSLNDSFNNCYNVPLYIKFIKSVNNEAELRHLASEFMQYTENYKNDMEEIYQYVINSNSYDNGTEVMCKILGRRYINIKNYWTSFEKQIPQYMKTEDFDRLLFNVKKICSQCLYELINTFAYDYCLNNNNEISRRLINVFNKYLRSLGVSTLNTVPGEIIDFDFYETNIDSQLYVTSDKDKMDKISYIHHYAYVFADEEENKEKMTVIVKGDVSVYCYQ